MVRVEMPNSSAISPISRSAAGMLDMLRSQFTLTGRFVKGRVNARARVRLAKMTRRFQLAIFDLDGTLIDSAPDIADSLNQALAERGLPSYSTAAVTRMIGEGVDVLVERALGHAAHPEHSAVVAAFRESYGARPAAKTRPYAGLPELLHRARTAGIVLAIATNKPNEITKPILIALKLLPLFSVVIGAEPGLPRKPDPTVVRRILELTRVGPGGTLYVGDSLVDLATAQNAGVPAALVTWGYTDAAVLAQAAPEALCDSPE